MSPSHAGSWNYTGTKLDGQTHHGGLHQAALPSVLLRVALPSALLRVALLSALLRVALPSVPLRAELLLEPLQAEPLLVLRRVGRHGRSRHHLHHGGTVGHR